MLTFRTTFKEQIVFTSQYVYFKEENQTQMLFLNSN